MVTHESTRHHGSCFDVLPVETLALVALPLGLRDRLALFSSCRAAWACQKAAPVALWQTLDLALEKPDSVGQLAAFLSKKKASLGQLSLSTASAAAEGPILTRHIMLLLGALADSAVHTLALSTDWDGHVGGWLRMLPNLRSLSVASSAMVVGAGLSDLRSLTSLSLSRQWGRDMDTTPAFICLSLLTIPPRLQRLEVAGFVAASLDLQALPAASLRHLRSLSLSGPDSAWALGPLWDSLAVLTQLTRLELSGWHMQSVPAQLSALTGLQRLVLEGNEFADSAVALLPLAQLLALTRLSLPYNLLRSLPDYLALLPALKELDLESNNIQALTLTSASLTRLELDVGAAVLLAASLPGLPTLHTLHLNENEWVQRGVSSEDAALVLHALMGMPGFALLDTSGVYGGNPFALADKVLRLLSLIHFDILAESPVDRVVEMVEGSA